ncbi:class I SAM-dependent methyltransferase [Chitinophaga rhizophila]|uniref:S-adenosyl-L-methionine-dependent methyltransferase n=1 Tax=Chitinophaga rhizophila TaxID=2866212 RepID=A0ABS7GGX9_9BACT|nr:SAM-dependent methyltransferase [Chitinophaga rhizophila]MBW8686944.1 SAM-dependent methyltransferase [Chitinophaga rhizophila]
MKTDTASRTAQYMALFRALETNRPSGKRLFTDPYAFSFLTARFKFITQLSVVPFIRNLVDRIIRRKIPGALSSGIARTRYIDELLQQTVRDGVKQVVILGAGYDTRALRLGFLRALPVIEVDHPATARSKQERLLRSLGRLPAHVRYLEIDSNEQKLEHLSPQCIDKSLPTVFIWEGVSNYLSPEAVAATFAFMGQFAAGTYIIFTYVDEKVLRSPAAFFGGEKLIQELKQEEEQWTFGLEPFLVRRYLDDFGIELLEDHSAVEYRSYYLPERNDKGYEFYRVAFAIKR